MMNSSFRLTFCLFSAILFFAFSETAVCQLRPDLDNVRSVATFRHNFDYGIRQIKYNSIPDLTYKFDDYLQYSPAAAMVIMKACGYKSRTSWGRMLVSDAFSAAIMAALVNGTKYSVRRLRPDGTSRNSFPSGHTATSFMVATMFHKEYGWRSPWLSFGAYTLATVTGISRIINDRHWASDVAAGAVFGIVSTQLGYFIADKIFKDRYISSEWQKPVIAWDYDRRYYDVGIYFGQRFVLGKDAVAGASSRFVGGGSFGIEGFIPITHRIGICARTSANSLSSDDLKSFNLYNALVGGAWRMPFAKVMFAEAKAMAGYSFGKLCDGFDFCSGIGLGVLTGENFKIKAFAEYETLRFTRQTPFIHTVTVGGSASFFW